MAPWRLRWFQLRFKFCNVSLEAKKTVEIKQTYSKIKLKLIRTYIENTRWVAFDIKFTRQGLENTSWHREACQAIQHAFSKPSLVNLKSKDTNLDFYLSAYQVDSVFKLANMA